MKREHFFIVGAQRSGTTYLYELLDAHPEIEMARPVRPEPKFFLNEATRNLGAAEYEAACFDAASTARVRGEKSTSYIESADAAARIRAVFPDARIVFLLREPAARAVSNYRFSLANGLEKLSMWDAFAREEERIGRYDEKAVSVSPFAYQQRGHYIDYIEAYERVFPREALHLMLHEDLVGGEAALVTLFEFLGVDPSFRPPVLGQVVNATGGGEELSGSDAARLRAVFAESNARLSERYGLDLSGWAVSSADA